MYEQGVSCRDTDTESQMRSDLQSARWGVSSNVHKLHVAAMY